MAEQTKFQDDPDHFDTISGLAQAYALSKLGGAGAKALGFTSSASKAAPFVTNGANVVPPSGAYGPSGGIGQSVSTGGIRGASGSVTTKTGTTSAAHAVPLLKAAGYIFGAPLAFQTALGAIRSFSRKKLGADEKNFANDYGNYLSQTADPDVAMALARMKNKNIGSDSIRDGVSQGLGLNNSIGDAGGDGVPSEYNFYNSKLTREQRINAITTLGINKLVENGTITREFADSELQQIHPPLADANFRASIEQGLTKKPLSFREEVERANPSFTARESIRGSGINLGFNSFSDSEDGSIRFGPDNPVTINGRIPSANEIDREINILNDLFDPSTDSSQFNIGDAGPIDNRERSELKLRLQALSFLRNNLFPADNQEGATPNFNRLLPSFGPNFQSQANQNLLKRLGINFSGVGVDPVSPTDSVRTGQQAASSQGIRPNSFNQTPSATTGVNKFLSKQNSFNSGNKTSPAPSTGLLGAGSASNNTAQQKLQSYLGNQNVSNYLQQQVYGLVPAAANPNSSAFRQEFSDSYNFDNFYVNETAAARTLEAINSGQLQISSPQQSSGIRPASTPQQSSGVTSSSNLSSPSTGNSSSASSFFGDLASLSPAAQSSFNTISNLAGNDLLNAIREGANHIRSLGIDNPIFGSDAGLRQLRERTLSLDNAKGFLA